MKLFIFGASGSGVTTLGRALAAKLKLPYFDSDDYYWIDTPSPFTVKREPELRNQLLRHDLDAHSNWILGGPVFTWNDEFPPVADLIIFLYLPQAERMQRLERREWDRYGEEIRTDPARKRQFDTFLAWAADYDNETGIARRTLSGQRTWLAQVKSPVLELRGEFSLQIILDKVLDRIATLNR